MEHTLTIITAGQTPRAPLVSELKDQLETAMPVREIGALDGLSDTHIRELEPSGGEIGIATLLRDGRSVSISESWLRQKFQDIAAERGRSLEDLTVIASTGVFDLGSTGEYVLHSQMIMDHLVDALMMAGQRVGKIYPLTSQPSAREYRQQNVTGVSASAGDKEALLNACDKLDNCDFIILNSLGYSEEDRLFIEQTLTRPTVHIRKLIASAIAKKIRQGQGQSAAERLLEGSALQSRLFKLTKREREVFDQVVAGLANKEIARILDISFRTVEIHRSRMLKKMGVSNSNELMRLIVHNASQNRH